MKVIRTRGLILGIYQFFLFSFIGICLIFLFFHAAILALPIIAFMWTFCGFNFFTFIFGVEVRRRFKIPFAVMNFLLVLFILFLCIIKSEDFEIPKFIVPLCSGLIGAFYLLLIVLFLGNYFSPVARELKNVFKPDPSLEIEKSDCATKYPVLLVHGTGFRDRILANYWSIIPYLLREHGAKVYYSRHDAWANIETSAAQIVSGLEKALADSGAEKVNVIAHSKGGIDVRYAISELGIKDKVASFTMISSPNYGSKTIDRVYEVLGEGIFKFAAVFVDLWFRLLGDKKPDFYGTTSQFRFSYMKEFNMKYPNDDSIYTQSFAGIMKNPFSDFSMFMLNFIVSLSEGKNDGLVCEDSAKWGNYRGTLEARSLIGISHAHEVDAYRTNPMLKEHPGLPAGTKTIRDFYVGLVKELKVKGL